MSGVEQHLVDEWRELLERAEALLRHGFPPHGMSRRELQIIVKPSFDNWTGWEFYNAASRYPETSPVLVISTWRRSIDHDKLRDPIARLRYPPVIEPTIESRTVDAQSSLLESMRAELQQIRLPVAADSGALMLDGTGYELTFGSGQERVTYEFHEYSSPEWQPLLEWTQRWLSTLAAL